MLLDTIQTPCLYLSIILIPPTDLIPHFFLSLDLCQGNVPLLIIENRNCSVFNFSLVSTEKVLTAFMSIKSCAIGPDDIHINAIYMLDVVTDLFN